MNLSGAPKYLDYSLILPAISKFPVQTAYRLADLRGWLICRSRHDSRRHAERNVSRVFPSLGREEIQHIVLQHFQVESRNEMEAFWYRNPLSFFQKFVRIDGLDVLQEARESKRGILLFSGHMGSTGLFFALMGKHGIRLNIVARSIEPNENPLHPAVLRYNLKRVRRIEETVGRPFLLTGRGNYPVMREKLEKGEVIVIVIDVPPTLLRRAVRVRFLERQAFFADGIASLFQQTQARLLQWTIHRDEKSGRQKIEIVDVTRHTDPSLNRSEIVQSVVELLEEKIRRHPGHWLSWDSLEQFYSAPEVLDLK